MKIVAFITDPLAARRILDHVGLPSSAPAPEPARAPPEPEFDGDLFPDESLG
jgi:hypothetical protein